MFVVVHTHKDCHKHGERGRHPHESYAESEAELHNGLCRHHSPDDPCAVVEHVEGVAVNAKGGVLTQ